MSEKHEVAIEAPAVVDVDVPQDFQDSAKYPAIDRKALPEQVFDWQIVPENIKHDDPNGFQRIRLAAALDLLKFEVSDLPYQRTHEARMKMGNVVNFIDNTRNYLRQGMPPATLSLYNHWIDNLGAQAWNVLDGFFKAKDQRVFLHMVNLYNVGAFTLPGLDKPLNECSFAEVAEAEREEERLYWKHQQREGLFIPLTREDVKLGRQEWPGDQLTLDDFKLAAKQIEKAVLIVFEEKDGTRLTFKDLTQGPDTEPAPVTADDSLLLTT